MIRRFLKGLFDRWKIIARKIGLIQTFFILSIIYFLVIGITSLFTRLLGMNLLDKRISGGPTYWLKRDDIKAGSTVGYERPF